MFSILLGSRLPLDMDVFATEDPDESEDKNEQENSDSLSQS